MKLNSKVNGVMELQLYERQYNFHQQQANLNRKTQSSLQQKQQEFQPYTWVKLLELPDSFSFDEALLLGEHSKNQWYVWIPDYGSTVIHASQFYKT
jgi:predicted nuclease of restriction endonuclease-like (RecB) superfamily